MFKSALATMIILTSFQARAGMSNYLAWNKEAINVCFAGKGIVLRGQSNGYADWTERQKEYIETTLTKEYTSERTGYHFVGFKDCKETDKPDVVVTRKPIYSPLALAVKGRASVGKSIFSPTANYPTARGVVIFTASGIRDHATIIHEFGHILGLQHEHEHPDAKAEARSWCMHYTKDTKRYHYNMYTEFDEDSVMSYCKMQGDSSAGLSAGDIKHIRELYFYSSIKDKRDFGAIN